MPRLQVYLPQFMYEAVKTNDWSPSEILQEGVAARMEVDEKRAGLAAYLDDLAAEIGEPSAEECARAKEFVDRISRHLSANLADHTDAEAS